MYNFVANIKSGYGKGKKNLAKIVDYCKKANIDFAVHITNCQGHAEEITRALCNNGANNVIALGGDGTIHEVLNGIEHFDKVKMGIIPSGRGNDFASSAGISLEPIKAFRTILAGNALPTDYILVDSKRRCMNICGTGLDVYTLQNVKSSRNKIAYILSLVQALRQLKPYTLQVEVNGETNTYECIMAGVANGRCFGGGIALSPISVIDDGRLDVIVMLVPESGLFKLLGKFKKGQHMDLPVTRHFGCTSVRITNIAQPDYPVELDGEIYSDLTLDCRVVSNELMMFR